MKSYTRFDFSINDEALIALLFTLPFESFEEKDNSASGYIASDDCTPEILEEIKTFAELFSSSFSYEVIPDQNWNTLWESNFQPVEIGEFCRIRADFHDDLTSQFKYQITINPKMAFGTGHHETTYMMIDAMSDIEFKNKSVFDFGCGTGILAILASKLGANPILAIDIEKESYLNTLENSSINNVYNIEALEGTIESAKHRKFNIILANINRNVLLSSGDEIKQLMLENGTLLLSGILMEDELIIVDKYVCLGFTLKQKYSRDKWLCLEFIC